MPRLSIVVTLGIWMLGMLWTPPHGGAQPLPDVDELLGRFRATLEADPDRFGRYRMRQRIIRRDRGPDWELRRTTEKVYEVTPNAWGAPGQWVLVEDNGEPVSEERLQEQRAKLREAEQVSSAERERRRVKAAEARRELREGIDEIFSVTQARIVGRRRVGGYSTVELAFEPRPDASAKTRLGKVLAKAVGRVWLNEADAQLVRFEAEAIDTILYGWGVLARLHEGLRMEFERRLVNDEVWLPAGYTLKGSARVMLVTERRFDTTSEFFQYRRVDADTATTTP